MHAIVISAAVAAITFSATQAEARARFKMRSFSSTVSAPAAKPAAAPAPVASSGSGVLPGALLGASIAARPARARDGRDELPTASIKPADAPMGARTSMISTATTTPARVTKPTFVCGSQRTVGQGFGFCSLN